MPDYAYSVAVRGGLAYIACAIAGLVVVDVSVPTAPAIIGQEPLPGRVWDVALEGDYAYLAEGTALNDGGLYVVDISDPSDPVLTGSMAAHGDAYGVSVVGTYAYLADDYFGVNVVDVSNPAAPTSVRLLGTPGRKQDAFAQGDVLYVTDGPTGLTVADISLPLAAHTLGGIETIDFAYGVTADQEAVYVADRGGGLVVVPRHCPAAAALPEVAPASGPLALRLSPNPAWGRVRIDFAAGVERGPEPATLRVFDVMGRERQRFVTVGSHTLDWDGFDASGRPLPAGVYWLELTTHGQRTTAKLTRAR
jgi:hypothetical protein